MTQARKQRKELGNRQNHIQINRLSPADAARRLSHPTHSSISTFAPTIHSDPPNLQMTQASLQARSCHFHLSPRLLTSHQVHLLAMWLPPHHHFLSALLASRPYPNRFSAAKHTQTWKHRQTTAFHLQKLFRFCAKTHMCLRANPSHFMNFTHHHACSKRPTCIENCVGARYGYDEAPTGITGGVEQSLRAHSSEGTAFLSFFVGMLLRALRAMTD